MDGGNISRRDQAINGELFREYCAVTAVNRRDSVSFAEFKALIESERPKFDKWVESWGHTTERDYMGHYIDPAASKLWGEWMQRARNGGQNA